MSLDLPIEELRALIAHAANHDPASGYATCPLCYPEGQIVKYGKDAHRGGRTLRIAEDASIPGSPRHRIECEKCEEPERTLIRALQHRRDHPGQSGRALTITPAAALTPARMRFLDRPRLPLGELTMLAGEAGLGKSALIIDYAAKATRGMLDADHAGEPRDVLIAGTEESREATMLPRLIAAGADLARVHFLDATDSGQASTLTIPDDLDALDDAIRQTGAVLATLDPLSAFLSGKVNSWREHDVRRALAPLAQVARDRHAAILAVAHLNKGDADKLLQRVGGSGGFGAVVRSVIAFGRDPSDPDPRGPRRIIAHAKCNVAAEAGPLAAVIEPATIQLEDGQTLPTSRLVITGPADVEADDLLTTREDWTARDDAAEFLRAELAAGPVASTEIRKRADDAGHAWRTVRRAKDKLGARARKNGTGEWTWQLPEPLLNPNGHVDTLGHLPLGEMAKGAKASLSKGRGDVESLPLPTPAEQAAIDRAEAMR